MTKIGDTNGFRALATLRRAAADPRVEEIEGGGMDEGRVFIHLKAGWWFASEGTTSISVGNAANVRDALAMIERKSLSIDEWRYEAKRRYPGCSIVTNPTGRYFAYIGAVRRAAWYGPDNYTFERNEP
jgi:hypothetical protein